MREEKSVSLEGESLQKAVRCGGEQNKGDCIPIHKEVEADHKTIRERDLLK